MQCGFSGLTAIFHRAILHIKSQQRCPEMKKAFHSHRAADRGGNHRDPRSNRSAEFPRGADEGKDSRTKSDMRTSATALEAYCVDNNGIQTATRLASPPRRRRPPTHWSIRRIRSPTISWSVYQRPVAYVTTAFTKDPFTLKGRYSSATAQGIASRCQPHRSPRRLTMRPSSTRHIYQAWNSDQRYTITARRVQRGQSSPRRRSAWLLHSAGPDGNYYNLGGVLSNDGVDQLSVYDSDDLRCDQRYDFAW